MNDKEIHWENESLTELVNYILKNHHGYLKKEMPLLSKLTTTILKVHGSDHRELSQVHRLFHIIKINFDQHNIIQEKNILPLIKIYERRPSKETLIEILEEIDLLGK
ncbi:MAG: hypothetical protein GXY88_07380 [Tissierellia bacterium]|nr:hypothetical protein [Tissierellia bacterium]